jgi:hypothetical protein
VKRLLIVTSVPIWLDVSEVINGGIDLFVQYIWCYCKNNRTWMNWIDSINILKNATDFLQCPIQLCFFGSSFSMDLLWDLKKSSNNISIILWNIGSSYINIPKDIDTNGFVFMSGRSSTIMRHFYKLTGLYEFSYHSAILDQPRFDRLRNYFTELTCQNF